MNNASFLAVAPEVVLLAGALVVIILGVMLDRPRREWGFVAALSFVTGAGCPVAVAPGGLQKTDVPFLGEVRPEHDGHPEREFAGAY